MIKQILFRGADGLRSKSLLPKSAGKLCLDTSQSGLLCFALRVRFNVVGFFICPHRVDQREQLLSETHVEVVL